MNVCKDQIVPDRPALVARDPKGESTRSSASARFGQAAHHLVVTVAGIAATSVIETIDTFATNHVRAALYIADVPTGATGDIVVAMSGTCLNMGHWRLGADGLASATASATNSNADDPSNINVNTTAGGIVVGIGLVDAGTIATWTASQRTLTASSKPASWCSLAPRRQPRRRRRH
jgi:hypothetical protein